MKAIMFFIIISLVGCSSCPPIKKLTYQEEMRMEQIEYIKESLKKNDKMTDQQKFLYGQFYSCYLDVIQNPHTVDMLMPWQTKVLKSYAEQYCLGALQQRFGDIQPLLEAAFEAKK